jgi:predicted DCC family thiol-disulfide oxidoreductase YuxK
LLQAAVKIFETDFFSMKNYFANVFGADLRSLAALRIGCALLIIADLFQRSADLVACYTDYGVVPRSLVMQHSSSRWYVSLHFMSGVWQLQALLFVLAGLVAAALLVGYRTRLASILSWALFVSLCTRNPYIVQGGEMLLRVVLFWGMFLPWGVVYSVDSAWQDGSSPKSPWQHLSWGTAAYTIQIISMYWFTVLLKSGPQWWSEGSAVYYALSIDQLVTPIGKLMAELPEGLLKLVTWKVAAFEIVGPLLLLAPVRKGWVRLYTTLCFIGLQTAFLLSFFIGIFPVIGIISMFFFLPPVFWESLERRLGGLKSATVKIYYDQDCGFCLRTVRLIRELFLPQAEIAGAQSVPDIEADMRQRNSWVVVDAQGVRHYGYDGFVILAGVSRILKPFAPILRVWPMRWCGERLYRYVATHRQTSCRLPNGSVPDSHTFGKMRKIANVGLVVAIGYVFSLNLSTIPGLGLRIPETVRSASNVLGLDQGWNMFAPFPAKDDGWYVIPGRLRNGKVVDLFRDGKTVSFNKATYPSLEYKNHRWRKYMELLRKRQPLQPVYARYMCREWNRRHGGGDTLEDLEIIFVLEWTQPRSEYSPIEKQSIGKFKCGEF